MERHPPGLWVTVGPSIARTAQRRANVRRSRSGTECVQTSGMERFISSLCSFQGQLDSHYGGVGLFVGRIALVRSSLFLRLVGTIIALTFV